MASINDTWFEWKGHTSLEYGIVVLNLPSFQTPKERYEQVKIPGRAGSFTYLEGEDIYDNKTLTITCVIDNPDPATNLYNISKWLRGSGDLRISGESSYVYKARVINQISFDKIVRGNPHRTFQITFDVSPFLYLADTASDTITIENENETITWGEFEEIMEDDVNSGAVTAFPIITVYFYPVSSIDMNGISKKALHTTASSLIIENGSAEYTLYIDKVYTDSANSVLTYPHIVIDCENKYAYYGSTSATMCLAGDWPKIPTGSYNIVFTNLIKKVVINKKTRYLV